MIELWLAVWIQFVVYDDLKFSGPIGYYQERYKVVRSSIAAFEPNNAYKDLKFYPIKFNYCEFYGHKWEKVKFNYVTLEYCEGGCPEHIVYECSFCDKRRRKIVDERWEELK